MKIVALLSWFDESPSWLAGCVASLAPVVDHLVAVDGAYLFFPNAQPQSPSLQAEVVTETARATGIGLTLHRPQHVWIGNEVEKRSFMFQLGSLVADQNHDWFLIVDADEIVTDCPPDLRDQLAVCGCDVATFDLWQKEDWFAGSLELVVPDAAAVSETVTQVRGLVRALPNLRVEHRHYDYFATKDGVDVNLWGDRRDGQPAAYQSRLRVEHRLKRRDGSRRQASDAYYRLRDEHNIEAAV